MQLQTQNNTPDHHPEKINEITLLDYIELLLNHKKMIGTLVGSVFLVSVVVSLLLPVRYTATARVLPPNEAGGSMGSLLTQAEGLFGGFAGSLINSKSQSELYVGILKSRSVADDLIQRFELKKLYGLKYIEYVYTKLAKRSRIQVDKKNQIITVAVEDGDPQRAADMANAYVDSLDQINRKLNITEGQRKRQFLEERLTKIEADLAKAEIALKDFQKRHKLVSLEEQTKATIEAAAEIKGEIITAQTKLEVQRQFGTQRQIEAVMLMAEIEELQRQLTKIEVGHPEVPEMEQKPKTDESIFFIPIASMPDLGLKLVRLTREAKIQEKVFELMTTQFELAKMEEAKDVNVIQVLDQAIPPEKKSYPQRRSIVFFSTLFAIAAATIAAFILEYYGRLKDNHIEKIESIKNQLQFRP